MEGQEQAQRPSRHRDYRQEKSEVEKEETSSYGEQRNFRFKSKPSYVNEVYIKDVGEVCFPCIEKRKERKNNKLSVYENFEED